MRSKQAGREERAFQIAEVRLREEDGRPPVIVGHAAVFDEFSEDLGGFRERIQPGAFTKTLQEADVRALWNHDPNYVLGRTKNGTLSLREDKRGLAFEVTPPETQWASDCLVSIRRGDVDQMSFGFHTVRDEWTKSEDDQITRTLIEVALYDVSPVTFPAYPQTNAEVRAKVSELQQATAAPGQEPHPAGADASQPRARLDQLRRRLDLAEQV
jgi:HK97 family phage prohead protease